jgi:hypothetical protein
MALEGDALRTWLYGRLDETIDQDVCFMLMLDRKLTAKATEVATRRREQ